MQSWLVWVGCLDAGGLPATTNERTTVEKVMSVRKLTVGLLALVALLAGMRTSNAQEGGHYVPVADPFAFDPDFRWFEPIYDADLHDMRPSKRANTGWFATYDRMHLYVTRPESGNSHYKHDSTGGNRFDIGFMLEEDSGWLATFMDIEDPEKSNTVRVNRINRLNPEDLLGGDPEFVDVRGNLVPTDDRNTFGYSERLYFVGRSLNVLEVSGFELNKTFRLEPYHYGGILEPMIGVRYASVDDTTFNRAYQSTEKLFPDIINPDDDPTERFIEQRSRAENDMFGGQLGFRYFKFMNRFTLSTDFRAFGLQNFQSNVDETFTETTIYDGEGIDAEVLSVEKTSTLANQQRNDEFVVGFDIRGEVAYQLTRDISIRGGFQMYDFARGIWRGRSIDNVNDQELIAVGGTFGVTLNR